MLRLPPGAVLAPLGSLAAGTAALELSRHPFAPVLVPACLAVGSGATALVTERAASRLPGRSAT